MVQLIDGKAISKQIKDELKEKVAELSAKGIKICLAVIQVGNDPASSVYVGNKKKACAYIGIDSLSYVLSSGYFILIESTQLCISIAIVIGPTPPGTGVIAPATLLADSKSTSPHNLLFSSLCIPTSITVAPSLI